jgi:putative MATE family efflux protein
MTETEITSGPIRPTILKLAWPVILAEGLHTAFQLVDIAWLRGLGPHATAAATTAMFALWTVFSLGQLVTTGVTAHVARAIGAGDRAGAARAAAQAVNLALLLGILVAIAGWFGARSLFDLIGAEPQVASLGTTYLRLMALGAPASFLYLGAAAVMRATGDTVTPLAVIAVSVGLNLVMAPFLIYGWGPFPRLEVAGAAITTVSCQVGAVIAFGVLALRRHRALPLAGRELGRLSWPLARSIVRIGMPYCVVTTSFSIVYLFFSRFAAQISPEALAVVGVANRLESLCYLPADGFASASATMVGQNLGAGKPARAMTGAWNAVGLMAALAGALTLLFLSVPRPLLGIFTDSPHVLAIGVPYLRVLSLCLIAVGVEGVIAGALAGAGDTLPVFFISVGMSCIRVPIAYLMAIVLGFGLMGIAWTITITCVVRAVILGAWFLRGRWVDRKLLTT